METKCRIRRQQFFTRVRAVSCIHYSKATHKYDRCVSPDSIACPPHASLPIVVRLSLRCVLCANYASYATRTAPTHPSFAQRIDLRLSDVTRTWRGITISASSFSKNGSSDSNRVGRSSPRKSKTLLPDMPRAVLRNVRHAVLFRRDRQWRMGARRRRRARGRRQRRRRRRSGGRGWLRRRPNVVGESWTRDGIFWILEAQAADIILPDDGGTRNFVMWRVMPSLAGSGRRHPGLLCGV